MNKLKDGDIIGTLFKDSDYPIDVVYSEKITKDRAIVIVDGKLYKVIEK